MRIYVLIWLVLTAALSYEYFALHTGKAPSVMRSLSSSKTVHFSVAPESGKPISLALGWTGLGLMILMNVYSLRKRIDFLRGSGKLSSWLNFHVFCGLLGPTLILFHSDFKVRGLVAIAFWSMMISFTSGVIGRYFYLQVAMRRADLTKESEKWMTRLKRFLQQAGVKWNDREYNPYMHRATVLAGVPANRGTDALTVFFMSIVGDWRIRTRGIDVPKEWPEHADLALIKYAVSVRRSVTLESYQRLMGYWHAFHFPFAIFMYISATVHVAASLIFTH